MFDEVALEDIVVCLIYTTEKKFEYFFFLLLFNTLFVFYFLVCSKNSIITKSKFYVLVKGFKNLIDLEKIFTYF
jgi:hypothetical protein